MEVFNNKRAMTMKGILFSVCMLMATAVSALNLPLPPGTSLSGGISCGGVPTTYFIKGFDVNGNVLGGSHSRVSCSSGGRGSRPHVYYFDHNITWDFFGGYVISAYDGNSLDTVATDAYGNVAFMAGTIPTLTINQMPPNAQHVAYAVPNVTGMTEAAATATLRALTFVVVVNHYYTSNTIPSGTVFGVGQLGAMLPVGSTVTINVAISCDGTTVNCD